MGNPAWSPAGRMRVSACTPSVTVTLLASTRGCAAKARVGRVSSHKGGKPSADDPSGIERHIFVHSRRAAFSMKRSSRMRAASATIWSDIARSISDFTSRAPFSFTPPSWILASARSVRPTRLASSRQPVVILGRDVSAIWPLRSARRSSGRSFAARAFGSLAAPVSAPTILPICSGSWPVMRSAPVRSAPIVSPSARPVRTSGERSMV